MGDVDPGRSITYVRDPNYWGRDLPVSRGRFNFDEIRFDYFRDNTTLFEAFKSGLIDVRNEDDPGNGRRAIASGRSKMGASSATRCRSGYLRA